MREINEIIGFPSGSGVMNLPAVQEPQEMWVLTFGLERLPGAGNGYPLQYSCLENPIDRGAWFITSQESDMTEVT